MFILRNIRVNIKIPNVLFIVLRAATVIMTAFNDSVPSHNNIKVSWTSPEFQPYFYQVTSSCKLICDTRTYYLTELMMDSNVSACTVPNLLPGTTCIIKLIAIYNPASLDPGITLSASTLYASTRFLTCLINNGMIL